MSDIVSYEVHEDAVTRKYDTTFHTDCLLDVDVAYADCRESVDLYLGGKAAGGVSIAVPYSRIEFTQVETLYHMTAMVRIRPHWHDFVLRIHAADTCFVLVENGAYSLDLEVALCDAPLYVELLRVEGMLDIVQTNGCDLSVFPVTP